MARLTSAALSSAALSSEARCSGSVAATGNQYAPTSCSFLAGPARLPWSIP